MPRKRKWLDPDRYIETETLAAMLGLSVRSLYRRIDEGVVPPPTHRGRPNRFDVEALVAHVERTDPWLSCQLAGGIGRLRAYSDQYRRLWGARGWRRTVGPDGVAWVEMQPPAANLGPGSGGQGVDRGDS